MELSAKEREIAEQVVSELEWQHAETPPGELADRLAGFSDEMRGLLAARATAA